MFPWLTARQAADALGVSDSRIRQLVGEGRFPRPRRTAAGVLLFHRDDVKAYLHASQDSSALVALVVAARQQADDVQPYRLTLDIVRTFAFDIPVHIRLYHAPEGVDPRYVAIVSAPALDGWAAVIDTSLGQIAERVVDEFLGDGTPMSSIAWVRLSPGWGDQVYRLANPVLAYDPSRRHDYRWHETSSPLIDLDDLDHLLGGAPIDWWHWEHYTPELIQAWQRTGQPVEVDDDPGGLGKYVDAIECLRTRSTTAGIPVDTAIHAEQALLIELAQVKDATPHRETSTADLAANTMVNTTRVRPYVIPDPILDAITDAAARQHLQTAGAAIDALRQIYAATLLVDEYADRPDPGLAAALNLATDAQNVIAHDLACDEGQTVPVLPASLPHVFDVGHQWDHVYLEACTWLPREIDPTTTPHPNMPGHTARLLKSRVGRGQDTYQFGHDRLGNPVLRFTAGSYAGFAALWPRTDTTAGPLPQGIHLVSDNGGGARPVYLVRHGEIVGLLPCPHDYGWSHGYGGGSPTSLAHDIRSWLGSRGRTSSIDHLLHLTTARRPDDEHLDIDVDALPIPLRP